MSHFNVKGNIALLGQKKEEQTTPTKRRGAKADTAADQHSMVMHNGAMLDIQSLLQKLDKGEKSITEYEKRIKELEEERGKSIYFVVLVVY